VPIHDHCNHKWFLVPSLPKYPLKDTFEFTTDEKFVTLRGFGTTTGLWTEWVFWEPKISGIFDKN
jgi:hypothetical protein